MPAQPRNCKRLVVLHKRASRLTGYRSPMPGSLIVRIWGAIERLLILRDLLDDPALGVQEKFNKALHFLTIGKLLTGHFDGIFH